MKKGVVAHPFFDLQKLHLVRGRLGLRDQTRELVLDHATVGRCNARTVVVVHHEAHRR